MTMWYSRRGGSGSARIRHSMIADAITNSAATAQGMTRRQGWVVTRPAANDADDRALPVPWAPDAAVPAGMDDPLAVAWSESKKRATAMSPIRARRSFSRHRWTSVTTGDGTSAGKAVHSGVDFTTDAIVSAMPSPGNARARVSISYSTAPKAHTSVRLSTGWPRACSGDM